MKRKPSNILSILLASITICQAADNTFRSDVPRTPEEEESHLNAAITASMDLEPPLQNSSHSTTPTETKYNYMYPLIQNSSTTQNEVETDEDKINPFVEVINKTNAGESIIIGSYTITNIRFRIRFGQGDYSDNDPGDGEWVKRNRFIYRKFYLKDNEALMLSGETSGLLIQEPGAHNENIPNNRTRYLTIYPTFTATKPGDRGEWIGFPTEIDLGEEKDIKTIKLIVNRIPTKSYIYNGVIESTITFDGNIEINKVPADYKSYIPEGYKLLSDEG